MRGAVAQCLEQLLRKQEVPGSNPTAHTLFQEIGLVTRQTRVQLPDSYICAKLVDFAHFAVEELVRHFDVTRSD